MEKSSQNYESFVESIVQCRKLASLKIQNQKELNFHQLETDINFIEDQFRKQKEKTETLNLNLQKFQEELKKQNSKEIELKSHDELLNNYFESFKESYKDLYSVERTMDLLNKWHNSFDKFIINNRNQRIQFKKQIYKSQKEKTREILNDLEQSCFEIMENLYSAQPRIY